MLDRKLWENFSYLTVIQVLLVVMPLIYYPYVVRVYGSDEYGEILMAQAIVGFFSIFINFGFNISATKSVSINREDILKLSKIFSGIFYIKIIFLILSFIFLNVTFTLFDDINVKTNLVYIAFIFCISDVFLVQWFYQGIENMKLMALSNLMARILSLFLIFYCIDESSKSNLLIYILSLSMLLSNIVMFIYAIWRYKIKLVRLSYLEVMSILRESAMFFSSRVSVVFIDKINITLLGTVVGSHYVSLYDLSSKLVSLIQLPLNMLNQAIYPRVAKSKDINMIYNIIKKCLVISIPVIFLSFFIVKDVILLYAGNDFIESAGVFYILSINLVVNIISHFSGNCILVVMGYSKQFNLSIIYSAFIYTISIALFVSIDFFDIYISSALIVMFNFLVMAFRMRSICKGGLYR